MAAFTVSLRFVWIAALTLGCSSGSSGGDLAKDAGPKPDAKVQPDAASGPEALLKDVELIKAVAVHGDYVFFTRESNGPLGRVKKGGGAAEELVPPQFPLDGGALVVDDSHIYFALVGSRLKGARMMRVAHDGTAAEHFGDENYSEIAAVAQDASHVYWTGLGAGEGGIYRRAKSGGSDELVVAMQRRPCRLIVTADDIVWVVRDVGVGGLERVQRAPKSDFGAVAELAAEEKACAGLHEFQGDLYWFFDGPQFDPGGVRVLRGGATTPETLVTIPSQPLSAHFDTAHLYLGSANDLARLPVGGGPIETFEKYYVQTPDGLAGDATAVYIATRTGQLLVYRK